MDASAYIGERSNNIRNKDKQKFYETLPDKERSSWQRAKSQILTVVSSEHEQNFKSVLQKLLTSRMSSFDEWNQYKRCLNKVKIE